jgi:hypothetical protein
MNQSIPDIRLRSGVVACVLSSMLASVGSAHADPPPPQSVDTGANATCRQSPPNTQDLFYCGGKLLTNGGPGQNLDVIPLVWGTAPSIVGIDLDPYLKALFDSNWLAPLSTAGEYSEKGVPLADTSPGTYARPSVVFAGIPAKDQPSGSTLDDTQIRDALDTAVGSKSVPTSSSASAVYMITTPVGVTVTITENGTQFVSCKSGPTGFTGYHQVSKNGLVYIVIPDCSDSTPQFEGAVSHELIESITDPGGGSGWVSANGEIGDLCENLSAQTFFDPALLPRVTGSELPIPLHYAAMYWENSMVDNDPAYSAGWLGSTSDPHPPHINSGCTFNSFRWLRADTQDPNTSAFNSNQTYLTSMHFDGNTLEPSPIAKIYADASNNVGIDMFTTSFAPDVKIAKSATWGQPGTQGAFASDEKFLVGDFDGDGLDDIAEARNKNGCIALDIHHNTGSSTFQLISEAGTGNCYAQGIWSDSWYWVAGDFNGDGRADIATIWAFNQQVIIDLHLGTTSLSPGQGFIDVPSAATFQGTASPSGSPPAGMSWFAGDVNGDGLTDILDVYKDPTIGKTEVDVHFNNLNGCASCAGPGLFMYAPRAGDFYLPTGYGNWHPGAQWMVGDFDGNGTSDLAEAFSDYVTPGFIDIDVLLSTCIVSGSSACPLRATPGPYGINEATTSSKFYLQRYATRQGGWWPAQKWFTGDFQENNEHLDLGLAFGDANNLVDIDVHLSQ